MNFLQKHKQWLLASLVSGLLLVALGFPIYNTTVKAETTRSGSIGIEGTINSPPPKTGATISVPSNGQNFTTIPITISGLCPDKVLVKIFKNNVFGGSAQCTNGSFSITADLFSGKNDLVARIFDDLDQAGPDSNTVSVTFTDSHFVSAASRVTLTSSFAKRGANPGEALTWPVTLSGGKGPYALSVDWGDGKPADLISWPFPGEVGLSHTYQNPGVYNIIVKATDADGTTAYLQLVGIGNGQVKQATDQNKTIVIKTKILWWLVAIMLPLIALAFWLGKRHELAVIRRHLGP